MIVNNCRSHLTEIRASAPCRVDMGGTIDISTFYLMLRHLDPCTFNAAIDLRTTVTLQPWESNRIRIIANGFESAEFDAGSAPFTHPLGLMFAVCAHYGAEGINVVIDTPGPPRAGLGGSSTAAVALSAALASVCGKPTAADIACRAHAIEQAVAGAPCGMQDHLAAVSGGVHAWYWARPANDQAAFTRRFALPDHNGPAILLAYIGWPHESVAINSRWREQFVNGCHRKIWADIVACAHSFVNAWAGQDMDEAAAAMNQEVDLRLELTPDVLDAMGHGLIEAARGLGCGARFCGAGAGGCLWALGSRASIDRLRPQWHRLLRARREAGLLNAHIDAQGLLVNDQPVL